MTDGFVSGTSDADKMLIVVTPITPPSAIEYSFLPRLVFSNLLTPSIHCQYCPCVLPNECLFVQSAWEETALFWELRPELISCTVREGGRSDSEDDESHDHCVGFPVRGLCVPTTGR